MAKATSVNPSACGQKNHTECNTQDQAQDMRLAGGGYLRRWGGIGYGSIGEDRRQRHWLDIGFYLGDEAVASGGNGFYKARLAGVVVERFAQQADRAGERAFGHGCVGPDSVQDLLLAHQASAILEEIEQEAEGFGFQCDWSTVRGEAEGHVVGLETVKAVDQRNSFSC
jgi:hypothetical protein